MSRGRRTDELGNLREIPNGNTLGIEWYDGGDPDGPVARISINDEPLMSFLFASDLEAMRDAINESLAQYDQALTLFKEQQL